MVSRNFELLKIESLANIVPDKLQLSPAENRSGITPQKVLDDLNTITKTFQDEDLHLFMIMDYLDCAISVYSELEQHCGPTSQIVEDQKFESAVVIQGWQQGEEVFALTKMEIQSVRHLQHINIHSDNEPDEPNTNTLVVSELQAAFQAFKKRKMVKRHDAETVLT